jgi:hypothetical protein
MKATNLSILVVSYSYTGTCHRVAQTLCAQFGWPSGEITDAVPRSRSWRCVLDSLLRRRPAIRYTGPAPEGFDAVVLVAPIWASQLAGPMRTFVSEHGARLRHVAGISVMGDSGAPNAIAEISRLLGRPPLVSTALTTREVNGGSAAGALRAFGNTVVAALSKTDVLRPAALLPQSA